MLKTPMSLGGLEVEQSRFLGIVVFEGISPKKEIFMT